MAGGVLSDNAWQFIYLDYETGTITGTSPGTANIYIRDPGGTSLDTCTITVVDGISGAKLQLPSGTVEIEDEAFRGIAADNIVIPAGAKSIGAYAFADSKVSYITVHIPDSVTSINPYAFSGCENVMIFGKHGSAAETYANAHDNCSFVEE